MHALMPNFKKNEVNVARTEIVALSYTLKCFQNEVESFKTNFLGFKKECSIIAIPK